MQTKASSGLSITSVTAISLLQQPLLMVFTMQLDCYYVSRLIRLQPTAAFS